MMRYILFFAAVLLFKVFAAVPGLPFSEDFSNLNLKDTSKTTVDWSEYEQAVVLGLGKSQEEATSSLAVNPTGSDIDIGEWVTSIAFGDMDGDGDLDVVAGNRYEPNLLLLNNGTDDPFSGVSDINITADEHDTRSITIGDVDGDGDLDVIAGNFFINYLYLNNGTADPFKDVNGTSITGDSEHTFSITLGDVDGDGDLDLIAGNYGEANRLYLNDGSGNFAAGKNITSDSDSSNSLALGDMDGDGDLDLIAGNSSVNRLYLNNGTADPFSDINGTDIPGDIDYTKSIALGDLDGDGDLDLVVGNDNQVNRLYLNNGTADPFSDINGTDITADVRDTESIALGDVDGDGDLDLVVGNYVNQRDQLYLNNGTADPFSGVSGTYITDDLQYTDFVALGDLDGDGDLDLIARKRLYLNNDPGTNDRFATATDITGASGSYATFLNDINGDGDLDLLSNKFLFLNNGTDNPFKDVIGTDITNGSMDGESYVLGDIDGDGDLDVVICIFFSDNRSFLNDGAGNFTPGTDIPGNQGYCVHHPWGCRWRRGSRSDYRL